MTSCETRLRDQLSNLSSDFDSLPTPTRVGLLSYQIAAKAMKKAFKMEQSIASVDRLFALFLKQDSTSDELLQCAIEMMDIYHLDHARIQAMQSQLTGFLSRNGFDTIQEFEDFVDTVFGGFGYVVSLLFQDEPNAKQREALFINVAKAIGVSRTLREVHEDVANGFVMLPKELMNSLGVDLEALRGQKVSEGFAQLINRLIEEARRRYQSFYTNIDLVPKEAQVALLRFVKIQEAILDEIIWNRYDCLNTGLVVSPLRQRFIRFRVKRMIKRMSV
jgi:phytoene/squalene synthetase